MTPIKMRILYYMYMYGLNLHVTYSMATWCVCNGQILDYISKTSFCFSKDEQCTKKEYLSEFNKINYVFKVTLDPYPSI